MYQYELKFIKHLSLLMGIIVALNEALTGKKMTKKTKIKVIEALIMGKIK